MELAQIRTPSTAGIVGFWKINNCIAEEFDTKVQEDAIWTTVASIAVTGMFK